MLKIWKRTWNGSDDPCSTRDSDQEDISGGPSSSASSLVVATAAPPSDVILPSVLPLRNSGLKRELEDPLDDQPHKKPRRDRQPGSDSLGQHLPEIIHNDNVEPSVVPRSISDFRQQVMEQAKHENSEFDFSFYNYTLTLFFSDCYLASTKKCKRDIFVRYLWIDQFS